MQFRMATLLVVITLISLVCGILFAAPPALSASLVCLIVLVSPAFWISGVLAAKGWLRAFFIGGTISGIMPFVVTGYTSFIMAINAINALDFRLIVYQVSTGSGPSPLTLAAVLFFSGTISCCGGGVSVLTLWLITRRPFTPAEMTTPPISQ